MSTSLKIGLLRGDGIGPEIVPATQRVAEAAIAKVGDLNVEWTEYPIGWEAIRHENRAVPDGTKAGLADSDGWIMGPHDSASYPQTIEGGDRNPSGELRHHFDLYANVRPARSYPVLGGLVEADLIVVRENTEGFLSDRNMHLGIGEFMPTPDMALTVGVFTRKGIERVARTACELAMKRRKKLSIVHKANVIKISFGFFRDLCKEVAAEYPGLVVDDFHIDAMTAHMVRRGGDFDVIVTENLFGDILSDLAGELVGSLGLSPALNSNDTQAMAQAAHGAAPDIAGRNIANPVGLMLSTAMMFTWFSGKKNCPACDQVGQAINRAIEKALSGSVLTPDLKGSATTDEFTDAIIACI